MERISLVGTNFSKKKTHTGNSITFLLGWFLCKICKGVAPYGSSTPSQENAGCQQDKELAQIRQEAAFVGFLGWKRFQVSQGWLSTRTNGSWRISYFGISEDEGNLQLNGDPFGGDSNLMQKSVVILLGISLQNSALCFTWRQKISEVCFCLQNERDKNILKLLGWLLQGNTTM